MVVDDVERADLLGGLFEVAEFDDEVAGFAPEQHDAEPMPAVSQRLP